MSIRNNFNHTIYACYTGLLVQAAVNNFIPLLFVTFNRDFGLSFKEITFFVTANFLFQLFIDMFATKYADKIGYRALMVTSLFCACAGLLGLGILPFVISPFWGILICVCLYAVGGGVIEVLVSPMVEACPTTHKAAAMSLLHSFYCWGHIAVVLISVAVFSIFSINSWRYLAFFWAALPLFNAVYFMFVPVVTLHPDGDGASVRQLFKSKIFWFFIVLMVCSGASEISVSQWISAFAETGLEVSKTVGDLAGPCMFAFAMALSRVFYAKFSRKVSLKRFMVYSGAGCVVCYLITAFASVPILSLAACMICGFCVGIFWPGTYSLAQERLPHGGTAMFGLLALAGDLGCSTGPTLVGLVSGRFDNNLKMGFLAATIFPAVMLVGLIILKNRRKINAYRKSRNT